MSERAKDLLELNRLAAADDHKAGSLIEHLRREYALNLIAPGCNDQRGGA
jgi:hypothetical protein